MKDRTGEEPRDRVRRGGERVDPRSAGRRGAAGASTSWLLGAALLTALFAASACGHAPPPADQLADTERQGRALFLDNCALCHGDDARGDGPLPGLEGPAADLTRIAARRGGNFPTAQIARYIDGRMPLDAHRAPEMPVWGRVMGNEVADPKVREAVASGRISAIVLYLRSIQVQ
jgi:mono/diheme cytochrome c family protein